MTGVASYLHPLTSDVAGVSPAIDTAFVRAARVDIHVEAFTNGTTPAVTFVLETLGLDGRWKQCWTSGALTAAPADTPVDVGDFSASYTAVTSTMAHAVFGAQTRLRWTLGGGVAPDAVTFSASVYPRS